MGELYAIACAMVWAVAVLFFRRSGESMPPLALNLFRVGISSVLFVVTLAVLGRPLLGGATNRDALILAASGIIAIAISDTLFHMCLNRVGAGITAIVDTLYSPFITLFAFLMLGERLGPIHFLGMGLVVAGVLVATRVKPPPGTARRTLIAGVALGGAAMATLTFGIVLAKPVLERTDVLWATTIRQLASLVVLVAVALLHSDRRRLFGVFRPQRSWRYSLPGTLLGSYFALLLWIAGMKYAVTGIAGILNQTSTLYILVLASLVLKEPFTRRKGISVILTMAGILIVLAG